MDVFLLLGNTSFRYGVLRELGGDEWSTTGRVPWQHWDRARDRVARDLKHARGPCAVVGSVRDEGMLRVREILPATIERFVVAREDFPVPIENRYEPPDDAGTDRLLNAVAASDRAAGRGAIVIDLGTAVSVSVVSTDGAFIGGLVAAGAGACFAGLEARTPRLPPQAASSEAPVPAAFLQRATAAAIRAGVGWSAVGAASFLLDGVALELGAENPVMLATGGDASWLAPLLPQRPEVVETLTLDGLRSSFRALDR